LNKKKKNAELLVLGLVLWELGGQWQQRAVG
jgi:hypothetical protein